MIGEGMQYQYILVSRNPTQLSKTECLLVIIWRSVWNFTSREELTTISHLSVSIQKSQEAEKEGGDQWSSPSPLLLSTVLLSFSRNNSIWVSPRPLASSPVCWLPQQCQRWIPCHGVSLKSKQRVVGHSYNIDAIITPLYGVDRSLFVFCIWIDDYLSPVVAYRVTSSTMHSSQWGWSLQLGTS